MKTVTIARSRSRFILHLACWTLALLLPCMAAAQVGQITFPANNTVVSGDTLVSLHLSDSYDPTQVVAVSFQYSQDGVNWIRIGLTSAMANGSESQSPGDWEAYWDTTQVPSGKYYLNAVVTLANGEALVTPSVSMSVNLPPIADAEGSIDSSDVAQFSGTGSTDPDGYIVSYVWDFGDGSEPGYGPTVSHTYLPGQVYTVTLTVTDNQGAWSTDTLSVDTTLLVVAKDDNCVGKTIDVAKNGAVIGNDGKGAGWPPRDKTHDGKTLGPISKNPDNKDDYWGYAFELRAKVEGKPSKCVEIQIIRATYVSAANKFTAAQCKNINGDFKDNVCTWYSRWTGTSNDFDKDGTTDLDLSTPALCRRFRGTWNAGAGRCENAIFPVNVKQYKPDESVQDTLAYRKPFSYKSHPDEMILWWDAPRIQNKGTAAGATASLNFVAIIKGTNNECGAGKNLACYCYADYSVAYVAGRANSENFNLNNKACAVDKSQVPGLK